jgi:putative salt-induced outer membrane protein
MKKIARKVPVILVCLLPGTALAQQTNDIVTEIELGAIFTSGNTEEENVKYGLTVDWLRGNWEYQFTSDGLRNSKDGVTTAQKLYHVARGRRQLTENSYWALRGAYEDDRFSGFDYQADITASYGRSWLNNIDNMSLTTDIGPGFRKSKSETGETFNEMIVRLSGEYEWGISDSANFFQNLALEFGEDSNIYRSETGIESAVMESLSLRFSFNVKHQTDVPFGREKTDTETAVTLVWTF